MQIETAVDLIDDNGISVIRYMCAQNAKIELLKICCFIYAYMAAVSVMIDVDSVDVDAAL